MIPDYEKRYLESRNTASPLNLNDNMTIAERSLEIIRYLKEAVKFQPIAFGNDIEEANAFLDKIAKEYEIDMAWESYECETYETHHETHENYKNIEPFDTRLKEDRNILKGLWIRDKYSEINTESQITGIEGNMVRTSRSLIGTQALLNSYVFADGLNEGKPVGKEVKKCI